MTPVPEVANLGVVRPPLVYLAAIVIGLVLGFAWPIAFLPPGFATPVGSALVLIAAMLFFYSTAEFRAAGTPVPGNRPTTAIVSTGPYRYSRNPIYVAFTVVQTGLAAWTNELWMIATLVAAVALIGTVVIPREEKYLEGKFGNEYLGYKATVRRWI